MTDEARCQTYVLASEIDDYPSKRCNAIITRAGEGPCEHESRVGEFCNEQNVMVNLWVHGPLGHTYLGPLAAECEAGHPQPVEVKP